MFNLFLIDTPKEEQIKHSLSLVRQQYKNVVTEPEKPQFTSGCGHVILGK